MSTPQAAIDLEDLSAMPQNIPKDFDAENAPNAEEIEMSFAVKAVEQAEAYWKLITSIKPSTLSRLSKWDDEIHEAFQKSFPELQEDSKLSKIDEDEMKSPEGKNRWREFMKPFEKTVEDYNFGTLLRSDVQGEYDEKNTIFAVRLQWLAIEIARNRKGLNDHVWEQNKK